jgi:4-amino-4-deoxy-L-arabinose transferase-like glycosyltransferase
LSRLSRFPVALGLIALAALAVRVIYALAQHGYPVQGDALTFHLVAQGLADGHGFREAFAPYGPTAEHPPLFELFLALLDKLGANGYPAHRLILGAVGTVNVVLIGVLARALAGRRAGLIAAAIAAVYPLLWTADGALMSETLYGTLVLAALLAAVRLARAPGARPALLLGALVGLAALTRGEGIMLIVLLALPLALRGAATWRGRGVLAGCALAALVVVLAPWTIRNLTTFDTPTLISTNSNGIFVGANCPATYDGPLIGAWRFQCYTPRRRGEDEAAYFARQRSIGLRYAVHHADRWPAVVAARLGRALDVFRVGQSQFFNAAEGRRADWVGRGIHLYWLVGLLALAGIAVLRRRREATALLILLAPVGMVLLVAIATYGATRFRYAAEPSLIVLAAVALSGAAGELFARARSRPARPRPA